MTPEQFEQEVVQRFPMLADKVAENRGLLHVIMGDLYRYTQEQLSARRWSEMDRVFRLLDEAYTASRKTTSEIENAIRVSFLEYFEFGGHEGQIRELLGPSLAELYDDQMRYMEDLARIAAEQRDAGGSDKHNRHSEK
ncbi:MAG TPA: hypothetical protein VGX70_14685 [Gemmataceae bacterium]|jgi:hypothetical protein|nr:hypothetical protein [Gemmataceae bacterium]